MLALRTRQRNPNHGGLLRSPTPSTPTWFNALRPSGTLPFGPDIKVCEKEPGESAKIWLSTKITTLAGWWEGGRDVWATGSVPPSLPLARNKIATSPDVGSSGRSAEAGPRYPACGTLRLPAAPARSPIVEAKCCTNADGPSLDHRPAARPPIPSSNRSTKSPANVNHPAIGLVRATTKVKFKVSEATPVPLQPSEMANNDGGDHLITLRIKPDPDIDNVDRLIQGFRSFCQHYRRLDEQAIIIPRAKNGSPSLKIADDQLPQDFRHVQNYLMCQNFWVLQQERENKRPLNNQPGPTDIIVHLHIRTAKLNPREFRWALEITDISAARSHQVRVFQKYHQCWQSKTRLALVGLNGELGCSDVKEIVVRYLTKNIPSTQLPAFNVFRQSLRGKLTDLQPHLRKKTIYCIEASSEAWELLSPILESLSTSSAAMKNFVSEANQCIRELEWDPYLHEHGASIGYGDLPPLLAVEDQVEVVRLHQFLKGDQRGKRNATRGTRKHRSYFNGPMCPFKSEQKPSNPNGFKEIPPTSSPKLLSTSSVLARSAIPLAAVNNSSPKPTRHPKSNSKSIADNYQRPSSGVSGTLPVPASKTRHRLFRSSRTAPFNPSHSRDVRKASSSTMPTSPSTNPPQTSSMPVLTSSLQTSSKTSHLPPMQSSSSPAPLTMVPPDPSRIAPFDITVDIGNLSLSKHRVIPQNSYSLTKPQLTTIHPTAPSSNQSTGAPISVVNLSTKIFCEAPSTLQSNLPNANSVVKICSPAPDTLPPVNSPSVISHARPPKFEPSSTTPFPSSSRESYIEITLRLTPKHTNKMANKHVIASRLKLKECIVRGLSSRSV